LSYVRGDLPRLVRIGVEKTLGGEQLEYCWYGGTPAPFEGILVIKTDRFGQQWRLELSRRSNITVRVAAGVLGVTAMTVSNWVRGGVFPNAVKRKGVTLIPARDVERVARQRGITLPFTE
jgi:hypothetical protein